MNTYLIFGLIATVAPLSLMLYHGIKNRKTIRKEEF